MILFKPNLFFLLLLHKVQKWGPNFFITEMTGMCCYLSFIPRGFSTEKIGPKGLISATVAGVALSESLLEEVTVGIRIQVGHPSRFPRRQGLSSWPLPPSVSFVLQMTSARINSVHQWDSKPISIPKGRFSHSSPTTFELCPPRSLGGGAHLWEAPRVWGTLCLTSA